MNYFKGVLKKTILLSVCCFDLSVAYSDQNYLMDLSVEDLLNVEVISVSKKAKSLNDSPAAIYVISQNDIKRIGATSIPEALRLAPGIDVARVDANKWAVSARGFNGRFANKLLVLVDGRNIYTRAFGGVYWENLGVMLEDVERIEVIRGPGATLWGANAVNGVINIITKHSADTQGGLLVAGGGTEEQGFGAFRYGEKLSSDTTARGYLKGFRKDESTNKLGSKAGDDWDKVQAGFRMDSQLTRQDNLLVQGNAFHSNINQNTTFPTTSPPYQTNFNERINSFGGNFFVRQKHVFSSTSDYSLQLFYDFYAREEAFLKENRHTVDIDFQHSFSILDWNDFIWGAGYRYSHDGFRNSSVAIVNPLSRNDQLFSAFVQDELTLVENYVWLTLGSKFEYNDYSGFEAQPTARLMWIPYNQHRLWVALSRAVRTPSRLEHDMSLFQAVIPSQNLSSEPFFLPAIAISAIGNNQFISEEVISYEFGYRTTFIEDMSIDLTAFYTSYSNLRSGIALDSFFNGTFVEQPIIIRNDIDINTYGFEISSVWQMLEWVRWDVHYSLLKTNFSDLNSKNQLGDSPQQKMVLRGVFSPWENIDLDVLFRYVDSNTVIEASGVKIIKDYLSMDIRLAWQPINDIELSLVGQNLLAEHHEEYGQELFAAPAEIDRGVYGKLTWKF